MSDALLVAAAAWALLLLGLYCATPGLLQRWSRRITSTQAAVAVIVVALVARLVPNFVLPGGATFDVGVWNAYGTTLLAGQDIYTRPDASNLYAFLPMSVYWWAVALRLAAAIGLLYVKVVRLLPILADVTIAGTLFWYWARRATTADGLRLGMLYALSPVAVMVSSFHGQYDQTAVLLLVLSLLALARSPAGSGAWLGLGILYKTFPLLALPSALWGLRSWSARMRLLTALGAVVAVAIGGYLLAFRGQLDVILRTAAGYSRGVGCWGYTYPPQLLAQLAPGHAGAFQWLVQNGKYLTLTALGLVWLIRARRETVEAGVLTVFVTFLAVTHSFGIQHLVWLVPLALLNAEEKWLKRYTLAACLYMIPTYTTVILSMRIDRWLAWPLSNWFIIMPLGLPAWLVTVGWLVSRLRPGRIQLAREAGAAPPGAFTQ